MVVTVTEGEPLLASLGGALRVSEGEPVDVRDAEGDCVRDALRVARAVGSVAVADCDAVAQGEALRVELALVPDREGEGVAEREGGALPLGEAERVVEGEVLALPDRRADTEAEGETEREPDSEGELEGDWDTLKEPEPRGEGDTVGVEGPLGVARATEGDAPTVRVTEG